MALNMDKLKARLAGMSANKGSALKWKPTKGKSIVRILPYKHNKENPFTELMFHYKFGKKTYLSPSSFGRPDPIVELVNRMKKSGDREQWKKGNEIEPKLRVWVPILVRGAEEDGVKFWGIGQQVFQTILEYMSDPEYGDITDPSTGRDLVVEFKDKTETKKKWGETSVRPRVQPSEAFDRSNQTIRDSIANMPDVLTLFPEPTYEELATVLNEWLNAPQDGEEGDSVPPADDEDVPSPTKASRPASRPATPPPADDDEPAAAPKTAAAKTDAPKSASASASVGSKSAKDVAKEFDDLFDQP